MPDTQSPQTNVEVVTDLMEYSKHGALIQAFVMVALEKYSEQVVKHGAAVFDSPFMNGAAWVGCAEETLEKIREHFAK